MRKALIKMIDTESGEIVARFVYAEEATVAARALANTMGRTYRVETADNDLLFAPEVAR